MYRANAAINAEADAFALLLNNGYIRIYTGAAPATPQAAATGTLLAELRFAATAFGANNGTGLVTANTIAAVTASNSGTAGYCRILKSDGTTCVADLTVGTSGSVDLTLNSLSIASGASVSITSCTYQATAN